MEGLFLYGCKGDGEDDCEVFFFFSWAEVGGGSICMGEEGEG